MVLIHQSALLPIMTRIVEFLRPRPISNGMKFRAGFTLIETLVYLGLFSIIIGGAFVAAFGIIESNERNQTKAIVQNEGAFVLAKIDWALSGIQSVDSPPPDGTPLERSLLSVTKYGGGTIKISLPDPSNPNVEIQRGTAPAKILNNSNVEITNLLFTHKKPADGNLESVEARFTVTARTLTGASFTEDFFTVKYIRR